MTEPRQTRSRLTRRRLLEAAVESLADEGWGGTTVVAVAARAGVSRGAAQHHFATRDDLVRAAVESVLDELTRHVQGSGADGDEVREQPLAVVQMLTDMWVSSVGRAAVQLWVAASTDQGLREWVLPLERRFSRDLFAVIADLLHVDRAEQDAMRAVRLTIDVTRGIGLGALLHHDLARSGEDVAQWAAVLGQTRGIGTGPQRRTRWSQ